MTNTTPKRKSPQEVEIDHLLAEEFSCDPGFSADFAATCGLQFDTFRIIHAVPEPSLGGEGYGDLLVEADMDRRSTALLIEDKITAAAATRQAERYQAHAERMRQDGCDSVTTVLVAPKSYRGEQARYDARVNLEDVAEMLRSPDERRLNYRRSIITRALEKKSRSGVQNPDLALHRLHSDYLNWIRDKCDETEAPYVFPQLKEAYYDGDSWIDKILYPGFPKNVWLRHRLWISVKGTTGLVDLVISRASVDERSRLESVVPDWAVMEPFSVTSNFPEGKGVQLSIPVPAMRQSNGFCETIASKALAAIKQLTDFFFQLEMRSR